ncbi:MAG TPA: dihydroorotase [Candidatus Limnocylindria bacterium]|jgi:dihydroorotase|nr:dihydroorotase [Candidatus Limnocylindria bacterium]
MSDLLLVGGRVIDPASGYDQTADVLLREGKVAAIGAGLPVGEAERMDVSGKVVCPGLIDLHVHFREPGQTKKEDILSGAQCAARGGFTTVVCMPNTAPAIDNAGTVALIQERARLAAVRVEITGALTKGIAGEELAPIGSLFKAGVVALTDDGKCIQNNELMRRACEYARMFGLPIMDHCQDYGLVTDGVMHEGYYSAVLGLRGWPAAGEEMIVARNILLAEQTGTHIHCQHLSSAGSVRLLREAKSRGVPISGEGCAHHFTLTDACLAGSEEFWKADGAEWAKRFFGDRPLPTWPVYHTHFKLNPPLRSAADVAAIREGLADGTLEIISSDHAPHTEAEKDAEFDYAPFGILGLEVELALALMTFHHTGRLTLPQLLAKLTCNPAKLLRFTDGRGELKVGGVADVTVFDPDAEWISRREETASKSRNNPFHDWVMKGKATLTVVGGKVVWSA